MTVQSLQSMLHLLAEWFSQLELVDFIDIGIVSLAIYKLIILTKETRASQVLKGLGLLLIASMISRWLGLNALVWIFDYVITNIALVLVVLFQPELRRALEKLGRGGNLIGRAIQTVKTPAPEAYENTVEEIVKATTNLAKTKTGALMIIQRGPLRDIMDSGTYLYARVSRALLENIFVPNTPLHDGATVISGDTILASGCFLPLSNSDELSKDLGTRHRAAMGMAESTDAFVIVVSEETGTISIAERGQLYRPIQPAQLRKRLNEVYAEKQNKPAMQHPKLLRRKGNE